MSGQAAGPQPEGIVHRPATRGVYGTLRSFVQKSGHALLVAHAAYALWAAFGTAVSAALLFFAQQTLHFSQYYVDGALGFAIVVAGLSALTLSRTLQTEVREKSQLHVRLVTALKSNEQLEGDYSRGQAQLEARIAELQGGTERYHKIIARLRALAWLHAQSDSDLFGVLNGFLVGDAEPLLVSISAIALIESDIRLTLDDLCKTLKIATGYDCAACIKTVYSLNPNLVLADARVETEYRDTESRRNRHEPDGTQYALSENTITLELLVKKNSVWACDDLNNLPNYVNNRSDWRKFYNATLGVRIPALLSEHLRIRDCGILCVDNMEGGLKDDTCIAIVEAAASRLMSALYRLRGLNANIQRLGDH